MNRLLSEVRSDLPASIVVFFVALPLCLGIALASGAPLFAGIIAGIVGGVVVGSISGSQLGVSGPAAGLVVIVLSAISTLGSYQAFLLSVVIAGLIQLILAALKLGVIAYYFPTSVIKGMLSGIGIIIILKQIPHALGYDKDFEGDVAFAQLDGSNSLSAIGNMLADISPVAASLAAVSIIILLLWENFLANKSKVFTLVQGPVVAVACGILFQYLAVHFNWPYQLSAEHLVSLPVAADTLSFLKLFDFPDFSRLSDYKVYSVALTLAIIASIETLLCIEATDRLDPRKRMTPTNRELFAQGAGNMASGLLGGLPVTQVIVRSSANIQSGAKTKLSTILHGIFLLLSVFFVPAIMNLIPLSVLAAILIVVGFKLAKPSAFYQIYKQGWDQFIPFVATVIGVVFTDLLKGIGLGMSVAIFIILRNSFKNSHFLHIENNQGRTKIKMTLAEEVSFLNKGTILDELNQVPCGAEIEIDASQSSWIDKDVLEILENFKNTSSQKDIKANIRYS